jgi:hypothetical protein
MTDEASPGAGRGSRRKTKEGAKEPFVSRGDRPDVRLEPDTPIGELRVRDLLSILGAMATKIPDFEVGKSDLQEFFDKDFPEVVKGLKELKPEKLDKSEVKEFKGEKNDKLEIREVKFRDKVKLEQFEPQRPQQNPRLEQLIHAVSGLAKQVSQLADQVEELQKRTK